MQRTHRFVPRSDPRPDDSTPRASHQAVAPTQETHPTAGSGLSVSYSGGLPDGYEVTSVFTSDEASAVSLAYPGDDFAAIEAFFDDWTSSQSGDWSKSTSSISGDEGSLDSASWVEDDGAAYISVTSYCLVVDDSVDGDNCISVNVNSSAG